MKPHLRLIPGLTLVTRVLATKSDCQCSPGFDPNAMPKMNVTDFIAEAYANGTSIYSFNLAYWPTAPPASCGATLQGDPSSFVPVWGDNYCWNPADGAFVPLYWYWNLPDEKNLTLRVVSRYLITAGFCVECVESGTHLVDTGDVSVGPRVEYVGRKRFAIRPIAMHG